MAPALCQIAGPLHADLFTPAGRLTAVADLVPLILQ